MDEEAVKAEFLDHDDESLEIKEEPPTFEYYVVEEGLQPDTEEQDEHSIEDNSTQGETEDVASTSGSIKRKHELISPEDAQSSSAGRRKRKVWSKKEVLGFLKCYRRRKDEFQHSRKKVFAYSHVLKDMISEGITDSKTTTLVLEGKMRTLCNGYKSAKEKLAMGVVSNSFPYMDEMDAIFGDKPIVSNDHTVHLGNGETSALEFSKSRVDELSSSPTMLNTPSSTPIPIAMWRLKQQSTSKEHTKKDEVKPKKAYKMELFEKLQKILDDNCKAQQEILRNAEERKIKMLEEFLKKMEKIIVKKLN